MRYIYITEHNIRQMVVESVKQLIMESKQTKKAKRDMESVAKELKGLDQEQAKPVIDKFLQDVFHTITLDNKYTSKYAPPLFRLYLTGEMNGDDKGHNVIAYLLDKCTENEGFVLDPKELNINAFNKILKDIENAGQYSFDRANKVKRTGNSGYEIGRDLTFKQANEIGNYSYPGLPLCYTQSVGTWNDPRYSDNDRNICYVLLKKGWKELEPVHDNGSTGKDGDPYDTYGMSMIFFFVGPDGRLVCSNTRWNHNADWGSKDCDKAFTEEEISKLVGAPFNEEFPFIEPDERMTMRNRNIEQRLANGEDPKNIFDYVGGVYNGFRDIILDGRCNYLTKDNKILCKDWFKDASKFQNGFARVQRGDYLWNFIKPDGTYLSNRWFIQVKVFNDGFSHVQLPNGKWNYIRTDGSFLVDDFGCDVGKFIYFDYALFKRGKEIGVVDKNNNLYNINELLQKKPSNGEDPVNIFDKCYPEHDGFRIVIFKGMCNYLTKDNKILSEDWFKDASLFSEGFGRVKRFEDNLWNYIRPDGTYLSDVWFKQVDSFSKGLGRIRMIDNSMNCIKPDGTLLTNEFVSDLVIGSFGVSARKDGKMKIIGENGNLYDMTGHFQRLLDEGENPVKMFIFCYGMFDGFVLIDYNSQFNYLSQNKKILCNDWFIYADCFRDGLAMVKREDHKENFIKTDGSYLSDMWFLDVKLFSDGISRVELPNFNYNYLRTDGTLLVEDVNCNVGIFDYDNIAEVRKNGEFLYYINKKGERID